MNMSASEAGAIEPQDIRRLRRGEYHQLAETGIFDDERVELLHGQIVAMSPVDPAHDASASALTERLIRQLGERATVRTQSSLAAADDSEPLPDVAVVPRQGYWRDHPAAAFLVVEVARTSLRKDRGVKATLYGSVAVQEYWIVDLPRGCVEVLRGPDGHGTWASRRIAGRGESIALAAFPDVVIEVDRVVPPPG